MIFIDLANKRPTDSDIPGWQPWTSEQWQAWQAQSAQLLAELAALDAAGKREERNALIDANSAHWRALKEWLLALSAGKCWFSEARDLYSHYDVEHFRPKKVAKNSDGSQRDGYWWLAFDYMNFRVCGNVGNRKKGGWFPLKEGSLCSMTPEQACEESETPYLLDPIDEVDVSLLAFDEEGRAVPMPGSSDWEQARVEQTVQRLKLNEHNALAEARRKVWQRVTRLIEDFYREKSRYDAGNNPVAKENFKSACANLRNMTQPTAELSAVARCCLLMRNDRQLSRLLG
ncbi:hypothetical protein HZU77_010800 [Neisseriaceae bacterium TC5R-5]|nr:hypothetical protein [Neisseriaceae bacterium TC5R-5]